MAEDNKLMSVYEREGRNTSSKDPKMLNSRVFIGNLASEKVGRQDIENLFETYGKVLGVSLHKSYGFVQFDSEESAKNSVNSMHGHMLHGLKMDVNLAAERQKKKEKAEEAAKTKEEERSSKRHSSSSSRSKHSPHRSSRRSRSPHRSSRHRHDDDYYRSSRHRYRRDRSLSPPYISHELEYARLRDYDRFRGMPPPPFRDPYFDPLGPPRDPFIRPRDDPYFMDRFPLPPLPPPPPPGRMRDPFGPPDPYARMGPPPLPPPHDREAMYDRPNPNPRSLTPPPPISERKMDVPRDRGPRENWGEQKEKMVDMELIVVNRQQKDYADQITRRVEALGLVVDTIYLSPTVSLADALDDAANRGLLYAIIITSQHELHSSVTLTILHGRNPQEHKNMPLEDALGLVDRDFDRYMQALRAGRIPPRRRKNDVSGLLTQAASGEQLSANQLQQVIEALQKQKQVNEPPQVSQPPPQQQRPPPVKDDIQRQQADLQAKILSLLGSNAVVPPSDKQSSQGRSFAGSGGGARGGQYDGGVGSRGFSSGGNDRGGWGFGLESGGSGRGRGNALGRGYSGVGGANDNGVRGYGYGGGSGY